MAWSSGELDGGSPDLDASDLGTGLVEEGEDPSAYPRDCLECEDRVCLQGEPCPYLTLPPLKDPGQESLEILESAWDVALEKERTLCRLAELVYFALEMGYQHLGVAFCEDLREPATILVGVLRRFFDVVPVGCRVGGNSDPGGACNPSAVAAVLNSQKTDLNVLVGFCVGADSRLQPRKPCPRDDPIRQRQVLGE